MTTTPTQAEDLIPWAKQIATMEPLKQAAIARGADPGLANYLAQSAALQRHVNEHNARASGTDFPLAYASFEEFVLKHGQAFSPPPPRQPRPKGLRKGRNRLCFMNATHAALDHDEQGWGYVEGYAVGMIPAHHAWVLDAEGHVIETTWQTSGTAYFGVAFPSDVWRAAIATSGTYGVFGQALLEEPYAPDDFLKRLRNTRRRGR